mgnify:CR=1 FL=1
MDFFIKWCWRKAGSIGLTFGWIWGWRSRTGFCLTVSPVFSAECKALGGLKNLYSKNPLVSNTKKIEITGLPSLHNYLLIIPRRIGTANQTFPRDYFYQNRIFLFIHHFFLTVYLKRMTPILNLFCWNDHFPPLSLGRSGLWRLLLSFGRLFFDIILLLIGVMF